MINSTTKVDIKDGIQLHMVQSDKFKSVLFGLYIKRPLRKEEVSLNALLSRVIDRSTAHLASQREVNQALEMLYGSLIVSDVHKYGEKQMIQIKVQAPGEKHIGDDTIYAGVLNILNDMINHPRLVDGGFDPEIVEREKTALMSEIDMRRDQKDSWVVSCCIETMCKDEIYSIHELGSSEEVAKITPKQLYDHLRYIWQTSEIDICVIGDFEEAKMQTLIHSIFEFERSEIIKLTREHVVFHPQKVTYFNEPHDLTQGKMCLGYRVNVPYESELYSSVLVANVMLGGGGSSRFFKVIREREGLCYSIYARLEKYKSIMMVYAGVDFENFDKTERLVQEQIEDVKSGNISDEELEIAKKTVITNIQSISDYPNSYINFYYNLLISEGRVDEEKHIEAIRNVTKESIVNALAHIELDTVACLVKEENHA